MSVTIRNISVLNYAAGFTLWHYKAKSLAEALADGYFNDATELFANGDMVLISAPEGGAMRFIAIDGSAVQTKKLEQGSVGRWEG